MRIAELVGGLSLACDLTNAVPDGKVLRTAILAAALARAAGHDDDAAHDAYWVTILRYLGCTGFAHEEAHRYGGGNDHSVRYVMALADAAQLGVTAAAIARKVGEGAPALARLRAVATLLGDGDAPTQHARAQCDTALRFAADLGMRPALLVALGQVCERFDGRGVPEGLSGEGIALATRLYHVADVADLVAERLGDDAAIDEVARRGGGHLDPALARAFTKHARELLPLRASQGLFARFLDAEPGAHLEAARREDAARAFSAFADLKSVHTLGHSRRVRDLACEAARGLSLAEEESSALSGAALLHDLGRVGVPNAVWDHPGPLDDAAWERVRLHAYYTDRILARAPVWGDVARVASSAHERLDGRGYHRSTRGGELGKAARVLAAADVMAALTEGRPHRPARTRDEAADALRLEVREGKLDAEAVDAVLAAAGAVTKATRTWPKGLSDREVEVLRLLARGKTNKEIGALLGISPRTVQNHVAHAYDKLGVYSRAGAALFMVESGLFD